jgi:hypothetical protein
MYVDENGIPARPMGKAPSTHILKPDIQRSDIKVFASVVNEKIIMLAAPITGYIRRRWPTSRKGVRGTTASGSRVGIFYCLTHRIIQNNPTIVMSNQYLNILVVRLFL